MESTLEASSSKSADNLAELPETNTVSIWEQWKNKGNDFYHSKNYKAAVEAYTKALEDIDSNASAILNTVPTAVSLLLNRAAALLMLLQYREALSDCDRAISLDTVNSKAQFRKATALKGLGRLEEAIRALDIGLSLDPKSATAQSEKTALTRAVAQLSEARSLLKERKFRLALAKAEDLMRAIGAGGSSREVGLIRTEALIELGRTEEAYNLSNSLMKSAANGDVELLKLRARCFMEMGDLENAFKHLQQAVRSDPDNSTLRAEYKLVRSIDEKKTGGDEAFKSGRHMEAINLYSECLQLLNSGGQQRKALSSKLFLNRATARSKLNQLEDAVRDCNSALAINSTYLKALLRRADCLLALGGPERIECAIRDLESAAELESEEDAAKAIRSKIKKAKVQLKRSKKKDLYAVLGVSQSATDAEIKTAYRKAALKYHPDKQSAKSESEKSEAEAMFKSVGEAYEVLSNPEKKAQYDQGVELEDLDNPHASGDDDYGHGYRHGHGGVDPNIIFQMFMQQQQGR